MNNFSRTGVLTRPQGTTELRITLRNTSDHLVYQSIYIYDLDNAKAILVNSQNCYIQPHCRNILSFPLVINNYCDSRNIHCYEVVYGPKNRCITAKFSNV